MAGGVDDIDLISLIVKVPEHRCCSRSDGDATLLLLYHPVHGGGAVVNFTYLMTTASIIEDTLRRGRLTGVDVSHDADITHEVERIHHIFLSVLHNS